MEEETGVWSQAVTKALKVRQTDVKVMEEETGVWSQAVTKALLVSQTDV